MPDKMAGLVKALAGFLCGRSRVGTLKLGLLLCLHLRCVSESILYCCSVVSPCMFAFAFALVVRLH